MELSECQFHSLINTVQNNSKFLELQIQRDGLITNVSQLSKELKSITELYCVKKCNGIIGVPINFVDNHCVEQYEILECHEPAISLKILKEMPNFKEYKSRQILINGVLCQKRYHRVFIRKLKKTEV